MIMDNDVVSVGDGADGSVMAAAAITLCSAIGVSFVGYQYCVEEAEGDHDTVV